MGSRRARYERGGAYFLVFPDPGPPTAVHFSPFDVLQSYSRPFLSTLHFLNVVGTQCQTVFTPPWLLTGAEKEDAGKKKSAAAIVGISRNLSMAGILHRSRSLSHIRRIAASTAG